LYLEEQLIIMFFVIFSLISFFITLLSTPFLLKYLSKRNIRGRDLHKDGNPSIPEMGGLSILLGMTISLVLSYLTINEHILIFTLIVAIVIGLLGILDYFITLSPIQKVVSFSLVGLLYPLYLWPFDNNGLLLLLILPILFMITCNFTNMLAGFNGLEIGMGAIASFGVSIIAYMNKAEASLIISSIVFGALIAFLHFNKFPAQVFPGDVGTLIIGSSLFISILNGGFLFLGTIIFFPYILDAAFKFLSAGIMSRHSQSPTIIKNGKLYPPTGGNLSLPRVLLRIKPMGEKDLVYCIWSIEGFFVLIAIVSGAAI